MDRALARLVATASSYSYEAGDFVIGETQGALLGVKSDRHAITTATTRAGKGVGVIIPNLMLWPHNALVIDPKGEAVNATATLRKNFGQKSHVLDPFGESDVAESMRATFNPLQELDVNSPTIREDIETISDGIVMRPDPHAAHWDDGAQALISGLIAYLLLTQPKEQQNLPELRRIIRSTDRLGKAYEVMKTLDGCGGLAEAGASALSAKEGDYFRSNADKNTRWLDSKPMADALMSSSFSMNDIKAGNVSVYLVLPANYLAQHGRFLRLFVRMGIDAMAKVKGDRKCLFILDEFYSLGYIDEIAKAAGLMAGYGLQMWVFLQNLGQLIDLYGREGAQTFFGNADVQQFFAAMDEQSLEHISGRLGAYTESDIPQAPARPSGGSPPSLGDPTFDLHNQLGAARATNQMQRAYDAHQESFGRLVGRPRFTPDQIARLIEKPAPDEIAKGQIVFTHGLKPLYCQLSPFWKLNELASHQPTTINLEAEAQEAAKPKADPFEGKYWKHPRSPYAPAPSFVDKKAFKGHVDQFGWWHAHKLRKGERRANQRAEWEWNLMLKRHSEDELIRMDRVGYQHIKERAIKRWQRPRQAAVFLALGLVGYAVFSSL